MTGERPPEPEVLGLAAPLALRDGGVVGGQGAGGPGQGGLTTTQCRNSQGLQDI